MKTATRKMGLNKNYIVGLYDDSDSIPNPNAAQRSKELTEFFTRFKYFGPIVYGKTVNEVLDKALTYEVDYCIVQCVGHIIKEYEFFRLLESWMNKYNFFITGHIMDKQSKAIPSGRSSSCRVPCAHSRCL